MQQHLSHETECGGAYRPVQQSLRPSPLLARNKHDRIVVLREHHLLILDPLRRSFWHRRNARLGFKDVSQVVMIRADAHSSPQQVLQAAKRAHDGEPLLVHGRPPLLRVTEGAAQKPKWLMAHSFHLDAMFKFSRWDLRQETPPMVVRSVGKHQHLIPVLQVRQKYTRSHLLVLPCFLRDRPIRRESLGPALNFLHVLLQQHSKELDSPCQPRKRRPQPIYGLRKLHQLTRRLRAARARQSAQTFPVVRHLSP